MKQCAGLLLFKIPDGHLWFVVLVRSLYIKSGTWGFRACGRDQGAALDLPGPFQERPLDPKPF